VVPVYARVFLLMNCAKTGTLPFTKQEVFNTCSNAMAHRHDVVCLDCIPSCTELQPRCLAHFTAQTADPIEAFNTLLQEEFVAMGGQSKVHLFDKFNSKANRFIMSDTVFLLLADHMLVCIGTRRAPPQLRLHLWSAGCFVRRALCGVRSSP
jgi:hypothetical protein